MAEDYLDVFCRHLSSDDFLSNGRIDHIFIPGDISDRADPGEFSLADTAIKKIANTLNLEPDEVFFVPGNHDVNWPVMQLTPAAFWGAFRYKPMFQPGLIFQQRMAGAQGALDASPHWAVWSSSRLLVVAINTAASDGPVTKYGQHNGVVDQQSLEELDAALSNTPSSSECLRACILHHHPIAYSDMVPSVPDYSALVNAENLMELLSKHRIDLAVHGHKHVPHLSHMQRVSNGHPLTILGAGSFSAQLGSVWTGNAANQFHVIEVHGRNQTTEAVYGYVSSWNYKASAQWEPCHSKIGLPATDAFGSLTTEAEIEDAIRTGIGSLTTQGKICSWSELTALHPDLTHVRAQSAHRAMNAVAIEIGAKFYGDPESSQRDWMLIPQNRGTI